MCCCSGLFTLVSLVVSFILNKKGLVFPCVIVFCFKTLNCGICLCFWLVKLLI
jgi:hypothetical protein